MSFNTSVFREWLGRMFRVLEEDRRKFGSVPLEDPQARGLLAKQIRDAREAFRRGGTQGFTAGNALGSMLSYAGHEKPAARYLGAHERAVAAKTAVSSRKVDADLRYQKHGDKERYERELQMVGPTPAEQHAMRWLPDQSQPFQGSVDRAQVRFADPVASGYGATRRRGAKPVERQGVTTVIDDPRHPDYAGPDAANVDQSKLQARVAYREGPKRSKVSTGGPSPEVLKAERDAYLAAELKKAKERGQAAKPGMVGKVVPPEPAPKKSVRGIPSRVRAADDEEPQVEAYRRFHREEGAPPLGFRRRL